MCFDKLTRPNTLSVLFLSLNLLCSAAPSVADDITIGDISARLDEVEKRIKGENPAGDELATKEEVDQLKNLVKALTGRVELLEMKGTGATSNLTATMDKPSHKDTDNVANEKHSDSSLDHETAEGEVDVDDAEVQDLLENLGASSNPKAALKKKVEETREKATEKAEKVAPSLESGSPAAQFNQAKSLFNKKQYAEAEDAFTYYLETYPKGKEATAARVRLGEAQLEQANAGDKKKADSAAATFAKAYKANPKGTEGANALLGLSQAMAFKDKKKACTVLKKLQADFPKNEVTSKKAADLNKRYKCS